MVDSLRQVTSLHVYHFQAQSHVGTHTSNFHRLGSNAALYLVPSPRLVTGFLINFKSSFAWVYLDVVIDQHEALLCLTKPMETHKVAGFVQR